MFRFKVVGSSSPAVTADSFENAVERLLRRGVYELHNRRRVVSIGFRKDAGSFDDQTEIWIATVMLKDRPNPGELLWGGDNSDGSVLRTIVKLGAVR